MSDDAITKKGVRIQGEMRKRETFLIKCAVLCEKVPNSLSRCHTKRKTTKKAPKNLFNLKNWCQNKRRAVAAKHTRPSFGMTTTQDIRDLFT